MDGNAKGILKEARDAGLTVWLWNPVNRQKGQPDWVIPYGGITWLVECKKPGEKLSADQEKWHAAHLAAGGGPIATVHSYEELKVAIAFREPAF